MVCGELGAARFVRSRICDGIGQLHVPHHRGFYLGALRGTGMDLAACCTMTDSRAQRT